VARTVAPVLAGSAGMRYRTFLRWNGIGVAAWGVTCVVLGSVAGESWQDVAGWMGTVTLAVVGLGVVAWVGARVVRSRRAGADALLAPAADALLVPVAA
jgi:undecaprenyl-diphosphatase